MGFRSWVSNAFGGKATELKRGEQYGVPMTSAVSAPKIVNEDTALQVSAVWACVRLQTETISTLDLRVFDFVDGEPVEDTSSDIATILTKKPNQYQNSMEFRETMMLNLSLHGNCYAQITRNGAGNIISLNPLPALQIKPELIDGGSLVYTYFEKTGTGMNGAVISSENMLHIKLFGNGLVGLSPLAHAKTSISSEIAAEDFAAKYYINSGRPSGTLTFDDFLTNEQRESMKSKFENMLQGTENAHKLMVLEGGMKYQQVQLSPEAMQMMEARRFNLEDIARFWGIPSILINDNKDTTSWGSGIEQIIIGWLNTGLNPMIKRWEKALEASILPEGKIVRHNLDDLLRADTKGRGEFLQKMVNSALNTPNEGRKTLGLPPKDGGDDLYIQGAMVKLNTVMEGDTNE